MKVGAPLGGHRRGIVCACDVDDLDQVTRLVDRIDPVDGLVGYKLGSLLTLRHGLAPVVAAFRKITTKALLYDHQKAGLDIPSMGAEFVSVCREAGVDGLILFPLGGPTVVDAFVGATLKAGLTPIVGGALPLPDFAVDQGGYVAGDALARIAARAFELGARDFIVPATDVATIQRAATRLGDREAVRLFMPGIGPLGGAIANAFAAAPGLVTYAIIGRAVYAAPDPAAAAQRLAGEALAFEDAR
jgi:orotidine-5'-phosphate decarboxylase